MPAAAFFLVEPDNHIAVAAVFVSAAPFHAAAVAPFAAIHDIAEVARVVVAAAVLVDRMRKWTFPDYHYQHQNVA